MNDILKELESIIPFRKIENDFFDFLLENEDCKEEGDNFLLYAVDENYDNPRLISINKKDPLTILAIRSTKDYYGIFPIPLMVEVAIGKFTPPIHGFYHTDKCFARLNYDIGLQLITIDFYYNKLFTNIS